MGRYWPNAIGFDIHQAEHVRRHSWSEKSCICRNFTYGCLHTLQKAKDRIKYWEEDELLLVSWVQNADTGRIVAFKCYDDNVQALQWGSFERWKEIIEKQRVELEEFKKKLGGDW